MSCSKVDKIHRKWYNYKVEIERSLPVKLKDDYITLGQLLKALDYISSGGEAKHRMHEFEILVNGEPDNRRGRKVYPGDKVEINNQEVIIE